MSQALGSEWKISSEFRPFTWTTNDLIASEVKRLDQDLSLLGIEQTRVGMEFEFTLPEFPISTSNWWQEVKRGSIRELRHKLSTLHDPEEVLLLQAKIHCIKAFNAREVLMYDLIERDKNTKALLEPLFGQGQYGEGYYDVGDTLEIRIKHCDVKEIQAKRMIVLHTLYAKAAEFGLPLARPPHQHMHFSFWKQGGNLFDCSHPEFMSTGKALIEGVTRVLYDVHPVLIESHAITSNQRFALPANRDNLVRAATGRYEVRFNRFTNQDPDLMLPIVLAGALFGLNPKDKEYHRTQVFQATIAPKVTVHTQAGTFNFVADILNTTLKPDGSLDIPEHYIVKKLHPILSEIAPDYSSDLLPVHARDVIEFFQGIRILLDHGQHHIHWPTTRQPNCYEMAAEDGGHLLINLVPLQQNISLVSIHNRFVIHGGYDTQEVLPVDMHAYNPQNHARFRRMAECVPLKERFSQELLVALSDAIKRQITLEESHIHEKSCKNGQNEQDERRNKRRQRSKQLSFSSIDTIAPSSDDPVPERTSFAGTISSTENSLLSQSMA